MPPKLNALLNMPLEKPTAEIRCRGYRLLQLLNLESVICYHRFTPTRVGTMNFGLVRFTPTCVGTTNPYFSARLGALSKLAEGRGSRGCGRTHWRGRRAARQSVRAKPALSAAACCRFPPRALARGIRTCHNSQHFRPCFQVQSSQPASWLWGKRQQAAALKASLRLTAGQTFSRSLQSPALPDFW
jgi:hypothetical protein